MQLPCEAVVRVDVNCSQRLDLESACEMCE